MWGGKKELFATTASPKKHQRSQSWHNLSLAEVMPTFKKQLVGPRNTLPTHARSDSGGGWFGSKLPAPNGTKSNRLRGILDCFIVAMFLVIVLNFLAADGGSFAFQRRVCPKIVHGINSSYELYHQRTGPRIVVSSGAYNNVVDGVSRTLNRLVSDLQTRGYRVLVLAPHVDPPAMQHYGMLLPVPSLSIPFRPEYAVASGIDSCTREVLEEHDPVIVHIATPDYLGQQVQKWAIEKGLPIGCSYHTRFNSYLPYYVGGGLLTSVDGALWRWLSYFYGGCDQVYPPTERVGQEITDHGVETPMKIWPRGIDTTNFNVNFRSDKVRKDWGLKPGEVAVLFASRMVWEKNVRVYIDTMNYMIEQKYPIRPLVVGDGPAMTKVKEELLGNPIILGHLDTKNLSTAFASADIFFFPSLTETWGNVALEAMASGTPVVCAKGPGGSELVIHNETGYLVDVADAEDTTKGLAALVMDASLRKRLSDRALKIIKSESAYSWVHVTEMLVGHYNDLLTLPRKSSRFNDLLTFDEQLDN